MGAAGREAKLLRRSPGLRMRRDCASETTGVSVSERTQEGLSGPATSASQQRPPPRRSRGRGILPHADLTWLRNRGGRACDVRANSGPRRRVTGVFRVRGCLPEASTIFQKLNRFFLLFFQGCCTVLSAFLWGVIIALSMRSWVTSPRVTERIGGRGGKSKSKPYA